jgi:hypothetical protein
MSIALPMPWAGPCCFATEAGGTPCRQRPSLSSTRCGALAKVIRRCGHLRLIAAVGWTIYGENLTGACSRLPKAVDRHEQLV